MTEKATYAYGENICSWLSLEHNMAEPQRISLLNDVKIVQVENGCNFVAILTDDGQVFLASLVESKWETNETLRLISNHNDRFKMIACGVTHLLLLRQDGHVFAMGKNEFGQLTGNEKSSYESMIHIDNLENVKFIDCGQYHSLSLTDKGKIYSWGDDNCGQLGLGYESDGKTPCLVNVDSIDSRVKDIVAGDNHSLVLFENGQLWGCGSNYQGELGFDNYNNRSKLTKIPIENVQQIKSSKFHFFSMAYDGSSYYVWGETKYGIWSSPKRLDDHPTSFVSASAMIFSSPLTFGLTSTIYVFGSHDSISYQSKSILQLFDNQDSYDVEFLIDQKPIKACKCYLKSVSEYYCRMFSGNWSENDQVIINDYSYDTYYAYLRMLHTCEIHINPQNIAELVDLANCYGDEMLMKHCKTFIWNNLNEQTIPTYRTLINKYEIKELDYKLRNMIKSTAEKIDIDLFHGYLVYIDREFFQSVVSIFRATYAYGKIICSWLSLEHDMRKPQRISCLDDMKIVQVDSGWNFVAILTDDGQVFLASNGFNWKTKETLQLISNDNDRFKMIACGCEHLLMLRQDGHVFAIGSNMCSTLSGNRKSSYESMIHIDGLENVEHIACGDYHNLSVTNKGEIYSWGLNIFGQLGLGDEKIRNTPCLIPFPNDLINIRIKDVLAVRRHSLFLFENGQLWGCGPNGYCQLDLFNGKIQSKLTKIPIENVQQIACSKFFRFSFAYDGSSYYALDEKRYVGLWASPRKLDDSHSSFASASFQVSKCYLKSVSHDTILYESILQLFDNQDNYDVEFLIDKKRIKACKCYLKSVSEYYRRMFSGNWIKKDQVPIENYSYETYYAYVNMLHTGEIHINHQNITELVDLANCYGDERLMKHCKTFIQNNLNKQTMATLLPLINKYEMNELYAKLAHISI
nr:uncharacterized protein LOC124496883 [Dermatophagoides farinae]